MRPDQNNPLLMNNPTQMDDQFPQGALAMRPPHPILGDAPNIGNMIAQTYMDRKLAPNRMVQQLAILDAQNKAEMLEAQQQALGQMLQSKQAKQQAQQQAEDRDWKRRLETMELDMRQKMFELDQQNNEIRNRIQAYSLMKGKNALPLDVVRSIFGQQNMPQGQVPQEQMPPPPPQPTGAPRPRGKKQPRQQGQPQLQGQQQQQDDNPYEAMVNSQPLSDVLRDAKEFIENPKKSDKEKQALKLAIIKRVQRDKPKPIDMNADTPPYPGGLY